MLKRILMSVFAVVLVCGQSLGAEENFAKWEKDIKKFEAADKKQPPKKNGVLFIGSSSIRIWNTDKWFGKGAVINRGFGGSEIVDSIHFADRIVFPYAPKVIVLYAGDNDVNKGKDAKRVFSDYQKFVKLVHSKLPKTRVVFVAIKPSIARWKLSGEMSKANGMIAAACKKDKRLVYADIWTPMLGEDGKPLKKWFAKDNLHLNEVGYQLWTGIVKPLIKVED